MAPATGSWVLVRTQLVPGRTSFCRAGTEGVLIDEASKTIDFGSNTGTAVTTLNGAPIVNDVYVSIGGQTPVEVPTDFDSGGVYGSIPESALSGSNVTADSAGTLPAGTLIQVYDSPNADPNSLLYEYTTTATNSPTVVSSGDFDTGAEPFMQGPIYIDTSGSGETVFDYHPTADYVITK